MSKTKYRKPDNWISNFKTRDDIQFKKVYDEWDRINKDPSRRIFIINDDKYDKFKIIQGQIRLKSTHEFIKGIQENGYIGCVGLAGRK